MFWIKNPLQQAMGWSMAVAVLMLVGKLFAYFMTGSTAILSDAMESVIHIVATGLAAWSAWYSQQPPSQSNPYGYGKIAYFSAGFEGALIFIAALAILQQAVMALWYGPKLRQLDIGFFIISLLTLVNLVLGLYLVRTGRKHNSLILIANGQHVLTDMWTSAAVVVGVGVVWLTNVVWLDPVFAIVAALHIMTNAVSLMRLSFSGLMERVTAEETQRVVQSLEQAVNKKQIKAFHQLRFRRVHNHVWIEVHLLLPGQFSLEQAHTHASWVEDRLRELFPQDQVVITSHLEPEDHKRSHPNGHPDILDPFEGSENPFPLDSRS